MSSQFFPIKKCEAYCTCAINEIDAGLGIKEYDKAMMAEANPDGGEYGRRLYKALATCKNHLFKQG